MDYRTSLTCLLLLWIPSRDRTISPVTSTLHGYQSVFFEKIGPWTSKDLKLSPAQKTVMSPAWRCQCCPFEVEFRLAGSHILQKNGLPFFWFPVWSRQHPPLDSYPSILRGQDSIEMTSSLIIIRTGAARIRLYYPRRSMNRMPPTAPYNRLVVGTVFSWSHICWGDPSPSGAWSCLQSFNNSILEKLID